MRKPEQEDLLVNFEKLLHEWGARPPITSPRVARARALANLPDAAIRWPWLRLAAAAALLVALVVGVWRATLRSAGEGNATAVLNGPPPLEPNVVVWQLDDRTNVYFVLSPGRPGKGGVS